MQNNNSLLKKVFDAQLKFPTKGDWVSDITSVLKELQINKTFEEITNISKRNLSNMVKAAVEKHALIYLTSIQKQKENKYTIQNCPFSLISGLGKTSVSQPKEKYLLLEAK